MKKGILGSLCRYVQAVSPYMAFTSQKFHFRVPRNVENRNGARSMSKDKLGESSDKRRSEHELR